MSKPKRVVLSLTVAELNSIIAALSMDEALHPDTGLVGAERKSAVEALRRARDRYVQERKTWLTRSR